MYQPTKNPIKGTHQGPLCECLAGVRNIKTDPETRRHIKIAGDVLVCLWEAGHALARLNRLGMSDEMAAIFATRWDAIDDAMRAAIWEARTPDEVAA